MDTLIITEATRKQYENTAIDFDGNIEIATGLGTLFFIGLKVSGSLIALAGASRLDFRLTRGLLIVV